MNLSFTPGESFMEPLCPLFVLCYPSEYDTLIERDRLVQTLEIVSYFVLIKHYKKLMLLTLLLM